MIDNQQSNFCVLPKQIFILPKQTQFLPKIGIFRVPKNKILPKQNYFDMVLPKQKCNFIDYQHFTRFCLSKINLPKQKYRIS